MKTKIPAYIFLKALGLTDKKIVHSIGESHYLEKLIKKVDNTEAIEKLSEGILNKETNLLRINI